MPDDLLQIRSIGVNFHVLRDTSGLYLIDGGFIGGRSQLKHALGQKGWQNEPIIGIVVTHGHLDHILNIDWQRKPVRGSPLPSLMHPTTPVIPCMKARQK